MMKSPWSRLRFGLTVSAALHGAALLAIVVAAILVLRETWVSDERRERLARFAEAFGSRIYGARDDPDALAHEVAWARGALGGGVALCGADGSPIVTTPDAPVACPDVRQRSELARSSGATLRDGRLSFALREEGAVVAYGTLDLTPLGPQPRELAPLLAVTVFALVLVSLWLAFRLSRPLERLVTVARAIAHGDTRERVGPIRGELGDVAAAFDHMAERILAMLSAQRTLLASLSHELRTPLARTRVVLDLAREGDEVRARRGLEEIARDVAELERLVDVTLETARVDLAAGRVPSGSTDLVLDDIDLRKAVEDAARKFEGAYPARRLVVEAPDQPIVVVSDRAHVGRVLDNLLDNARKYSPDGSTIGVRVQRLEAGARIDIDDDGAGLDDADLAHATDAFYRGRASRGTRGIGLGLALAQRALAALGGTLSFERRPTRGTRASVRLPLEPPISATTQAAPAQT